jgi:ethanolamine utilization protein EutQ (cupin superfamily)
MLVWECTAGRFNWFYGIDESVYVVEGSMRLKDSNGNQRLVNAGDTVFFPAGSHAEWTVDKYVKKVAFLRSTVPAPVAVGIRVFRRLWRLLSGSGNDSAPMFG